MVRSLKFAEFADRGRFFEIFKWPKCFHMALMFSSILIPTTL